MASHCRYTSFKAARNLYDADGTTVADIAKALGVSRATLYRHLKVAGVSTPAPVR